jgi:DNA polymerase I-like protein with 3'-5' exonuclease and polymerase domains
MDSATLPWFMGKAGQDALREKKHYVVLDFENTILTGFATNKNNHLVLACWYVVIDGVVQKKWHFGDEYSQRELHADLDAADFMVAHNAKYEAQWLQRSGYDLRTLLVYCTQVAEWVLLGNNPKKLPLDLDGMSERRLNAHKDELGKNLIKLWGVCPSVTPRSWLLRYCFQDVELTHRIFLQQHAELTDGCLWHIAFSRFLVIPVLADIELQGLQLDAVAVEKEYRKQLGICESAGLALDEITGGINLNSRPQVSKLLYDVLGFEEARDVSGNTIRTEGGARSTSEEAILRLKATTDIQTEFLARYKEYVKASTLLSKTLTFLKNVCDYNGGVFYGTINQGRTGTHRLASGGMEMMFPGHSKPSKVQLQNIPRQYKKMFIAHDPDYEVREDDGAQLEFRVAAELGNDVQAKLDIDNGEDIHASTRLVMRNAHHPNFDGLNDKEARQEAKPFTFQPLYGGRGNHPAEHAYADFWAKKYPDIYREQERWCMQVVADKCLITPYGMKFYWPHAKMFNSGRTNVRTEVFNYPVQGFATAEIIPIALVYYWHRCAGLRVEIFNTVHDSIISRVHKEDQAAVDAIAKQALTYDVYQFLHTIYDYEFKVPLGVGSKVGSYWGAGTERVWDVWPDGRERYQEKD